MANESSIQGEFQPPPMEKHKEPVDIFRRLTHLVALPLVSTGSGGIEDPSIATNIQEKANASSRLHIVFGALKSLGRGTASFFGAILGGAGAAGALTCAGLLHAMTQPAAWLGAIPGGVVGLVVGVIRGKPLKDMLKEAEKGAEIGAKIASTPVAIVGCLGLGIPYLVSLGSYAAGGMLMDKGQFALETRYMLGQKLEKIATYVVVFAFQRAHGWHSAL